MKRAIEQTLFLHRIFTILLIHTFAYSLKLQPRTFTFATLHTSISDEKAITHFALFAFAFLHSSNLAMMAEVRSCKCLHRNNHTLLPLHKKKGPIGAPYVCRIYINACVCCGLRGWTVLM